MDVKHHVYLLTHSGVVTYIIIIRLGTFPQVSLILTFADVPSAVETFFRTCAGFPVIARSFWVALQNAIKENVGVGDEISACPVQVGFAVADG